MNTNHPVPQGEGHDPPLDTPLTDEQVLIKDPNRQRALRGLIDDRAAATGSNLYMVLAQELGDDPLELVRLMVSGRYRWKRHRNGLLWIDADGDPVPEHMSLRQAAAELVRITRRDVSHEALRRWWDRIWPNSGPGADVPQGARWVERGRSQQEARDDAAGDVPPVVFTPPAA